jgi:ribosomal protein L13
MNGIETKTTRNAECGSGVTVVDVSSIRMTAMHQFSYNAFRRKGNHSGCLPSSVSGCDARVFRL